MAVAKPTWLAILVSKVTRVIDIIETAVNKLQNEVSAKAFKYQMSVAM